MKTIYLECNMGAAGDMLMAALLELHPDKDAFLRQVNALGIPKVSVVAEPMQKCGIWGTHVSVSVDGVLEGDGHTHDHGHEHTHDHDHSHTHGHVHEHPHSHSNDHEHSHGPDSDHAHTNADTHVHGHNHGHDHGHDHPHTHNSLHDIEHLLTHLSISEKVRGDAMAVYRLIADAESHAHGVPVSQIHFHEVGELDAVADIVGVCMLMEALAPDAVIASPVHVGSGMVRCAHGMLPVPAPATAYILQDVPVYGGEIRGELCTPTGAALLKHFATAFGPMPQMSVSAVGYGMGTKDFQWANCVRAFVGASTSMPAQVETVHELQCNLDDMTAEAIGYVQQLLLDGGALDVYTTAIGMKKSRPGVLLTCMCKPEDVQRFVALMIRHTTTLGVRVYTSQRYAMARTTRKVDSPYGLVGVKVADGFSVHREKLEYEDVARIASEHSLSFAEAVEKIKEQ